MKRHEALQDLARDHFHALVCAQKIRKAETAAEFRDATDALLRLWRDDLIYHFREEEEVLLPVLSRHINPSDDPDVRLMLDQHAQLRAGMRKLEAMVEKGEPYKRLATSMGQLLNDHARLEDRIIFVRLESLFTEQDLQDVADWSREARTAWAARRTSMRVRELPSFCSTSPQFTIR